MNNISLSSLLEEIETEDCTNTQTVIKFSEDYFPPNWINVNLSVKDTLIYFKSNIKSKDKKNYSEHDKNIVANIKLLRDCYCTNKNELKLANIFIEKFDLDPFNNPFSCTLNSEFSLSSAISLDGTCEKNDGFNIKNWPEHSQSIFVNPPFSKLKKAFSIANEVSLRKIKPSIAVIGNLDYTKYVKTSFQFADYFIFLGRIQYKPIDDGIDISSPRGSSAMTIYNSKYKIDSGPITLKGRDYFVVDLKNKNIVNILQMKLFDK